ncbi:hypothetical protein [Bifidobacterium leontopitheci]|uniref:Lipoprotein n=1 Tax=Bifidobacterium leontopitheci TaxID=2650774 RepID=A0A6I1GSV7_9BIFI|nr:hypothetical protein [Bifidobacterium leontopitheci]KAB7791268.1 hypothetical protein F7D09_0221 [Bifidobacterium leontopitheci]
MGKIRRLLATALTAAMIMGTSACGWSFNVSLGRQSGDSKSQNDTSQNDGKDAGKKSDGWQRFSNKDLGFSISFPGNPYVDSTTNYWTMNSGEKIKVTRVIYPIDKPVYVVYVLHSSQMKSNPVAGYNQASSDDQKQFLQNFPVTMADAFSGTSDDAELDKAGGNLAVDFELKVPDQELDAEATSLVSKKEDVITLLTLNDDADHDRFADSIKLLD